MKKNKLLILLMVLLMMITSGCVSIFDYDKMKRNSWNPFADDEGSSKGDSDSGNVAPFILIGAGAGALIAGGIGYSNSSREMEEALGSNAEYLTTVPALNGILTGFIGALAGGLLGWLVGAKVNSDGTTTVYEW